MKKIYLDQNIWLDIQLCRFNNSLEDVLSIINRGKVEVIYSPANIEEICNSYCSNNISRKISEDEKNSFIEMLSKITENKEIVPYSNNYDVLHSYNVDDGPFIVLEHPAKCFDRVFRFYASNEFAERSQEHSINKSREVDQTVKGKLGHKSFVAILEEDVNANNMFVNCLINKLMHMATMKYLIKNNVTVQPWNNTAQDAFNKCVAELRRSHSQFFIFTANDILDKRHVVDITTRGFGVCEAAFDALMLTMIEFGYASEKSPMSSLHDITHSIYGACCDYFVTRDSRLIKKLTSLYEFFGVKTKIINGTNEDWHDYLK